jgi:hypothetical protein
MVDVAGVLEVPGGDGDQDEVRCDAGVSGAWSACLNASWSVAVAWPE